jgi:cell division protein FtsB
MAGPGRTRPPIRRPERALFTSRAAVLAVVVCAIALSLAYPVREYIAQRRQIDQLLAQRQSIVAQLNHLQTEQRRLSDPAYVERLARDRLHLCMSGDTCYVVVGNGAGHGAPAAAAKLDPWYERLWRSVHVADHGSSQ